jgi:hypothetical protein
MNWKKIVFVAWGIVLLLWLAGSIRSAHKDMQPQPVRPTIQWEI